MVLKVTAYLTCLPEVTIYYMIFSSGREFDLYKVQNLGLCKILNTIFVLLFAMLDVLVRDSCFAVFSHASTCSPPLPCNTRREGQVNSQALPSSCGHPWETMNFESCRGAKRTVSQRSPRELGREPERLYLGSDLLSTNKANLH